MHPAVNRSKAITFTIFFALLMFTIPGRGQTLARRGQETPQTSDGPTRIPNRASTPLFRGKQGKQKTEIHFDPATRQVTLKLLVQDPNGYFIPNIRRENFVVYENGVRQEITSVESEDAPVSLGLLLEFGGRYLPLNRALATEVPRTARQLLDLMTRQDKAGVWKYSNKVEKISDLTPDRDSLHSKILFLGNPEFSDTNLYDAVIATVDQVRPVKGRKAIVLISSGIDTFSKATRDDALKEAQGSDSPIYAIGLSTPPRQSIEAENPAVGPKAPIDWRKADSDLQELAKNSGGRAYFPESTFDLSATYADLLENLKVRYVITYRSSTDTDAKSPRTVRVDLVNPATGRPLDVVDMMGHKMYAQVILEQGYVPKAAAEGD
jgi:VWFA-related protein